MVKFQGAVIIAIGSLILFFKDPAAMGQSVDIQTSLVGNPGNAPDTTGFGSVDYNYEIGTNDVTISQYCTFLNDVATSDPYGLYNSAMTSMGNLFGEGGVAGITQSGASGSYFYSVIGSSGNDPVTEVSWLDAARFCNWLDNGQPDTGTETLATTESGAYYLNGDLDLTGTTGVETKGAGATWWIPTENEWYKAAYYDPNLNGGSGGYFTYATQSNTAPGNQVGSGSNEANYNNGVYSVTQSSSLSPTQDYLTPVGSFTNSASYYGTYDQNGDVFQWNDSIYSGENRGYRGGSWLGSSLYMESSQPFDASPTYESYLIGFRVATIPEPGSAMEVMGGMFLALAIGKRRLKALARKP